MSLWFPANFLMGLGGAGACAHRAVRPITFTAAESRKGPLSVVQRLREKKELWVSSQLANLHQH